VHNHVHGASTIQLPQHLRFSMASFISAPSLAGLSETMAPAFSRAATLSEAAPLPPEMIAPA
jgi:hypothetical protein